MRKQLYLQLAPEHEEQRPKNRSECKDAERPCPWWGCRYHLGSDVDEKGELLVYAKPDEDGMPVVELEPSCALDVADKGAATLEEISRMYGGLSLEAVRQVELRALRKLRAHVEWEAPEGSEDE